MDHFWGPPFWRVPKEGLFHGRSNSIPSFVCSYNDCLSNVPTTEHPLKLCRWIFALDVLFGSRDFQVRFRQMQFLHILPQRNDARSPYRFVEGTSLAARFYLQRDFEQDGLLVVSGCSVALCFHFAPLEPEISTATSCSAPKCTPPTSKAVFVPGFVRQGEGKSANFGVAIPPTSLVELTDDGTRSSPAVLQLLSQSRPFCSCEKTS